MDGDVLPALRTSRSESSRGPSKIKTAPSVSPAHLTYLFQKWATPDGMIYVKAGVSEPPSKDFYQICVSQSEVVLKVWRIVSPYRIKSELHHCIETFKCPLQEFKDDLEMRASITIRSQGDVEHIDNLLSGQMDFLARLEDSLLLKIIKYLDPCSVVKLGATNKQFYELCKREEIWERLYHNSSLQRYATQGLLSLAHSQGWKSFYVSMFYVATATDALTKRLLMQTPTSVFVDMKKLGEDQAGRRYSANF